MDVAKNGAKPVDVTGKNIIVRMVHFQQALDEVKAAFGVDEDELKMYLRSDLLNYGPDYERLMKTCQTLINQVRTSKATPLLSVLLEGPNGSGKTSLAAKLAVDSGFPYVKVISPEQFVGRTELSKINEIAKVHDTLTQTKPKEREKSDEHKYQQRTSHSPLCFVAFLFLFFLFFFFFPRSSRMPTSPPYLSSFSIVLNVSWNMLP